jgi:glucan biosynthesis protein C
MDNILSNLDGGKTSGARVYYLDWLRVLAILMVFLFHAVHPFDYGDWHIKNVEQSEFLTVLLTLLGIWGMPFFFMVAGSASWFALHSRSSKQYVQERFNRLFVPFIVGTILFFPLQNYLEWVNKMQRGVMATGFQEFVSRPVSDGSIFGWLTPRWFGYGVHLWFLAFLFAFAVITLPLFQWMMKGSGKKSINWMARMSERRGSLLLFIIPLVLVHSLLMQYYPAEHDWADFFNQMMFFILGFILFADDRFRRAIRRDWWIFTILALLIVIALLVMYLFDMPLLEWYENSGNPQFYLVQLLVSALALCCCLLILYIGQRFLDFSNHWLRYGQEAALPFFVLHQPVIVVIAFFVVQWQTGIWIKLSVVVLSSFIVTISLYEFVIRRLPLLRRIFGMKVQRPEVRQVSAQP